MRYKFMAAALIAVLLLSGCTPAVNEANLETTSDSESQEVTETSYVSGESASQTAASSDNPSNIQPTDTSPVSDSVSPPPEPSSSAQPAAPITDWGTARNTLEMDFPDPDVSFTPQFREGGRPDDYITTTYDAADIVDNFASSCTIYKSMNSQWGANTADAYYPIECARKVDDNRFYAVYKINQGGYFYMFYQRYTDSYWGELSPYILTNVSYLQNNRSYADYQSAVAEGAPLSMAEAIDPSWGFFAWRNRSGNNPDGIVPVRQLLTDGVLMVIYKTDDENIYRVDRAEYHPDFTEDFSLKLDDGLVHQYMIRAEDYPQ